MSMSMSMSKGPIYDTTRTSYKRCNVEVSARIERVISDIKPNVLSSELCKLSPRDDHKLIKCDVEL